MVRNPFAFDVETKPWTKIGNEKSIVGTHTVKALLQFATTCLGE